MSNITTIARTTAATLVVLGLSSGIAVASPCETDAAFAAANGCSPVVVESADLAITPADGVLPTGLGLRVR